MLLHPLVVDFLMLESFVKVNNYYCEDAAIIVNINLI